MGQRKLSSEERIEIHMSKQNGQCLSAIAQPKGISYQTARKWWRIGRDTSLGRKSVSWFFPSFVSLSLTRNNCFEKVGPCKTQYHDGCVRTSDVEQAGRSSRTFGQVDESGLKFPLHLIASILLKTQKTSPIYGK